MCCDAKVYDKVTGPYMQVLGTTGYEYRVMGVAITSHSEDSTS